MVRVGDFREFRDQKFVIIRRVKNWGVFDCLMLSDFKMEERCPINAHKGQLVALNENFLRNFTKLIKNNPGASILYGKFEKRSS